MRRILFLEWNSIGNDYMKRAWERLDFQVDMQAFDRENEDTRRGSVLAEQLVARLTEAAYEFVFSFNYFPVAAVACKACRVKYVSWTYDSPFIQLYSKTLEYDTNYAFVFDKAVYADLRSKGINTVRYLPMAAAVSDYDTMRPTKEQQQRYAADVTFVGSLYREKKHNLFRHLDKLDAYTRGYLEALMQAQKQVYGGSFLESALTDEIMEKVVRVCPLHEQGDGMETLAWTFANYFLARKITAMERMEIMELLQGSYNVQLFTHEQTPELPDIHNMGRADYYKEAPYIFKCGKIHLNITLRSILTGIPQRAFDIMGCGGFLLSNYQEDYLEHFVPEEDFVYYESYEDMTEKIDYYLNHEEKRLQIAANGYEKVKKYHTYEVRAKEILGML